mmetsp:Transcript_25221/g.52379  ORF Transcript_25221/g.52379 Transcript_25221/m.52379 type:complete len:217 (-) Transcript_25221:592-1242(-)
MGGNLRSGSVAVVDGRDGVRVAVVSDSFDLVGVLGSVVAHGDSGGGAKESSDRDAVEAKALVVLLEGAERGVKVLVGGDHVRLDQGRRVCVAGVDLVVDNGSDDLGELGLLGDQISNDDGRELGDPGGRSLLHPDVHLDEALDDSGVDFVGDLEQVLLLSVAEGRAIDDSLSLRELPHDKSVDVALRRNVVGVLTGSPAVAGEVLAEALEHAVNAV